jgi:MEMO1 family protein
VPAEDSYRTPLGEVPLDRTWIAKLGERVGLTAVRGDEEHSLEIQLPFLQIALEEFSLVPIMLGDDIGDRGAQSRLEGLASALAEVADGQADDQTLLVASTDLTHLNSYSDVRRIDARLVDLIGRFDVDGLVSALRSGEVHACGATALAVVMRAAAERERRARGAQVLAYAASGDITGDKRPGTYTVGYLAAAVYG